MSDLNPLCGPFPLRRSVRSVWRGLRVLLWAPRLVGGGGGWRGPFCVSPVVGGGVVCPRLRPPAGFAGLARSLALLSFGVAGLARCVARLSRCAGGLWPPSGVPPVRFGVSFVRPWARRVGLGGPFAFPSRRVRAGGGRFRPSLLLVLFVGVARSFAGLLRVGGVVFAVPAAGGLLGGRASFVRPPVFVLVGLVGFGFCLGRAMAPQGQLAAAATITILRIATLSV